MWQCWYGYPLYFLDGERGIFIDFSKQQPNNPLIRMKCNTEEGMIGKGARILVKDPDRGIDKRRTATFTWIRRFIYGKNHSLASHINHKKRSPIAFKPRRLSDNITQWYWNLRKFKMNYHVWEWVRYIPVRITRKVTWSLEDFTVL